MKYAKTWDKQMCVLEKRGQKHFPRSQGILHVEGRGMWDRLSFRF